VQASSVQAACEISSGSDWKQGLFFGKVNWYNPGHESAQPIISRPEDGVYSFCREAFAMACDGTQNHQDERVPAGID
jgi:hypothetical protein